MSNKEKLSVVPSLEDASKKAEAEHISKVKQMFEAEPELWKDSIIISPSLDNIIYPGHLNDYELLGMLEVAKFNVLTGDAEEEEEENE